MAAVSLARTFQVVSQGTDKPSCRKCPGGRQNRLSIRAESRSGFPKLSLMAFVSAVTMDRASGQKSAVLFANPHRIGRRNHFILLSGVIHAG
jgi:hypothetical protein